MGDSRIADSGVVDSDIAVVAALFADRGRAAMLMTLLDGRPLAAGELARVGGVSPQTASGHLARLLEGGLVTMVKQGRHRYYALSGPQVAEAIEALSRISPPVHVRSLRQSRQAAALRVARTCYDHLAGRTGVLLLAAMRERTMIEEANADTYRLTEVGELAMAGLGVDVPALRGRRRRFAGPCLDWTERRPHLNGALGAALSTRMIELGWFERGPIRRALVLTETGRQGLQDTFGLQPP